MWKVASNRYCTFGYSYDTTLLRPWMTEGQKINSCTPYLQPMFMLSLPAQSSSNACLPLKTFKFWGLVYLDTDVSHILNLPFQINHRKPKRNKNGLRRNLTEIQINPVNSSLVKITIKKMKPKSGWWPGLSIVEVWGKEYDMTSTESSPTGTLHYLNEFRTC